MKKVLLVFDPALPPFLPLSFLKPLNLTVMSYKWEGYKTSLSATLIIYQPLFVSKATEQIKQSYRLFES